MNDLIFVVDDNEMILEIVTAHLANVDFNNVQTFTNPLDAIEAMKDVSPAAIISDLQMPGMSGVELLSKNSEIPGIIMTGEDAAVEGLRAKGFTVLRKIDTYII